MCMYFTFIIRIATVAYLIAAFALSSASGADFPVELRRDQSSLLAASSSSLDSANRRLGLAECFRLAEQQNKEIVIARRALPVSRATIQMAGAISNPQLDVLYGFGSPFKKIIAGTAQQVGGLQCFETAGKRNKQVNVARADYTVKELQLQAVIFDIHNRTRRAYAELAAARAFATLTEKRRKTSIELLGITQKRLSAGEVERTDTVQARLAVTQAEASSNQARRKLEQASGRLSLLLGETPGKVEIIDCDDNGMFTLSVEETAIVPRPERALPPLEQLLPLAYAERLDLKIAVQNSFVNRKSLSLARSLVFPDPQIECDFQYSTLNPVQPNPNLLGPPSPPPRLANADSGVSSDSAGNSSLDDTAGGTMATNSNANALPPAPDKVRISPQYGAFLQVTSDIPIFYRKQGEIGQARETWLQSQAEVAKLKAQVSTDVVSAYSSLTIARANVLEFQRELIPASVEVDRIARLNYETGHAPVYTAIVAHQQVRMIRSSYFDAVVTYQNAWADLEQAVGVPIKL